jgi:uncharacterized protein with NRDE domain
MCLILFAYRYHPRFHLILVANRDEFFDRPTRALGFWPDHPEIAAGRDLKQMGTWLGITRKGRLAAITNYREAGAPKTDAPSRGHLVADFLAGHIPAYQYLQQLGSSDQDYNGFNLIIGDDQGLYYHSNRGGSICNLQPGIYGLSNRLIDTDWPKVRDGKTRLDDILAEDEHTISRNALLELLQSQNVAPDDQLPETGVGIQWERVLAPIFITSPAYGTRASSLLTIDHRGEVHFTEITWDPARPTPTPMDQKDIQFKIQRPENMPAQEQH